jgi:predicted TPR repeat methyltransferase
MKTPDDYSISMAYSYTNSQELSMYYDDSAKEYDDYAISVGYVLPRLVAEKAYLYTSRSDVIIDIGCGTGLLGVELNSLDSGVTVHGVDISQQMISYAYSKKRENGRRHYEKLYLSDVGGTGTIQKDKYSFMVSSGTFTTGHLDGSHLSKIMESMKVGSFAVFSVKSDHFDNSKFMDVLLGLKINELIEIIDISEVDSYENSGYSALSKIISIKIN